MPLDSTTQIIVTVGAFSVRVWDEGTTHARIERNGFNIRGVTHWRCAYADALPLAQALLGGSKNIGATTTFQNGFSCPAFYGLAAQSVDISNEGQLSVDGGTGFAKWERALLEIHFGFDEFAAGDATGNIGELGMEWTMKEYPLDEGTYYYTYTSDGVALPSSQKNTIRIPIGTFKKVLYNRALLNTSVLLPFFNTVNSSSVTFPSVAGSPSTTIGRGQLYFPGLSTRTKLTPTGLPMFDLIYEFQYHPVAEGWNSSPRPDGSPTIWQLAADINGNPEFAYANHNLLFNL